MELRARVFLAVLRFWWVASAGGLVVFRLIFSQQYGTNTPIASEFQFVALPMLCVAVLVGNKNPIARFAVALMTVWFNAATDTIPTLGKHGSPGADVYIVLGRAMIVGAIVILLNCLFPFFDRSRRTA